MADELDSTMIAPPKNWEEVEQLAESFAKDAVEFAKKQGWSAQYERVGNSFIIFVEGVATNEIEISWIN